MSATEATDEKLIGRSRRNSSRTHASDARTRGPHIAVPLESSVSSSSMRSESPPPGPSNIIVLGANPLPAPRSVDSQ